jgi:hypothetical protein
MREKLPEDAKLALERCHQRPLRGDYRIGRKGKTVVLNAGDTLAEKESIRKIPERLM